MNVWKRRIFASCIGGSLRACLRSFRELSFNLRFALMHLVNYYGNRRILRARRLHFGCGPARRNDCLNIDLHPAADVALDARNPLPFRSASVDYIYSSHFIEHLDGAELLRHLQECRRLLVPGGVLRLCVPDFAASMRAYLNADEERLARLRQDFPLSEAQAGQPAELIDASDYLTRGLLEDGSHRLLLDADKLRRLLAYCGFDPATVRMVDFDPGQDPPARAAYSWVIEARG